LYAKPEESRSVVADTANCRVTELTPVRNTNRKTACSIDATHLSERVAADAGFHADVDLDVALGAGFGEAAGFGLFNFDFELALGAELFGADGVGAVDRALGMNAVAGEGRFAADGAEFANGLGSDDRFWFEDTHMAPISDIGSRMLAGNAPCVLASLYLIPLFYQIWVRRVFDDYSGKLVTRQIRTWWDKSTG
jgi:hypothetical protein